MPTKSLNDTYIRKHIKTTGKAYKVFDGHGLHLYVTPKGSKLWRHKYRFDGKEKLISYGYYPLISLADARDKCRNSQRLLIQGIDPMEHRKQKKAVIAMDKQERENTFETMARKWLEQESKSWSKGHAKKIVTGLERHIFPHIGNAPINSIKASELLEVLEITQNDGKHELTNRLRARCENVFAYAILHDLCAENPAWILRGGLVPPKVKSMATISAKEMPDFLKKIRDYPGHPITKNAVLFLAHTFVRTQEMRFTTWDEFDFEERVWTIPGERMKHRQNFNGKKPDHKVALTSQTIDILSELREYNGDEEYVFATPHRSGKTVSDNPRQRKPLSEGTVLRAIYIAGYKGRMTGHGFRSFASTQLNETGFDPDVIEMQLAHIDSNRTRAAYNRAEYLEKRKEMMHQWSDYIDSMIHGAKVIPIGKRAG